MGPGLAPANVVRAGIWLAAMALSGCFYIDVINLPPEARIERIGTGPVHIDDRVVLTARASTDDDGPVTFSWSASCSSCGTFASDSKMEFAIEKVPRTHDPLIISLWAFDKHGARGEAILQLPVTNQLADVVLQVPTQPGPDGTYPLTKPIVFAASATDPDGDTLKYSFRLHPPPQSNPDAVVFAEVSEKTYRLEPDVPGRWEVEVTVDDGFGGLVTARESVLVAEDAPPCIATTSPTWSPDTRIVLLRSAGVRRFAVESVVDDIDSHPGSGIHFRWLVVPPDASLPIEVIGRDLPDLFLDPTDLDPGDVIGVRVEIRDRVARALPCSSDQAACSIGGNSCLQRLTWTVEVR